MTYRVGVIGCGRMGSTIDDEVQGNASVILPFSHTAAYMEEPRVHVVAAADVAPDKRAAYRLRWDVERVYESHIPLLEHEKLDISVSAPVLRSGPTWSSPARKRA